MKVLIDTNILISAALSPDGTPSKAFFKAVSYPNKAIVCEQIIDELRRIFNRKFPNKLSALDSFLATALTVISVVPTPIEECEKEKLIRDVNDRPIFRAAVNASADIILTGDKDFLEANIDNPKILTAAEFIEL